MIQPKWSPTLQKWHIDIYSGTKRIKTFWSGKPGKQGRDEVIRKYEAYVGGNDDDITVQGEFERFFKDYKPKVSPETYSHTQMTVRNYILPKIGTRRLRSMRITDFQDILNTATKKDGSPLTKASIRDIRGTIVRFLKYAELDGCTVPSYGSLCVPKGFQTKGKQIIPKEAVKRLMDDSDVNTDMSFYANYFKFLLYTGCRPGEGIGLKYSDIDKNGFVTIQRSINTKNRITECKNDNAKRRFKLPQKALDVIKAQKEFTGWLNSEYVFCDQNGSAAKHCNTWYAWNKIAKQIGAEGTSPYSFRHTFVSYYGSLPLAYLKTILGHGVNMETYHYYHDTDEQTTQAASILDSINEKLN